MYLSSSLVRLLRDPIARGRSLNLLYCTCETKHIHCSTHTVYNINVKDTHTQTTPHVYYHKLHLLSQTPPTQWLLTSSACSAVNSSISSDKHVNSFEDKLRRVRATWSHHFSSPWLSNAPAPASLGGSFILHTLTGTSVSSRVDRFSCPLRLAWRSSDSDIGSLVLLAACRNPGLTFLKRAGDFLAGPLTFDLLILRSWLGMPLVIKQFWTGTLISSAQNARKHS